MTLARLLALSPLLGLLIAPSCHAQRYSELNSYVASKQSAPYLIADFDDDGVDELVSVSGSSGWISAMSWRDNRWQADYLTDMSPAVLTRPPQIWQSSEGKKVLVLRGDGLAGHESSLLFLEGWPLRPSRSLRLPHGAQSALIADPDLDGNDDLLVLTGALLFCLDPATGVERWQAPYGGDELQVAQLDSDMPLEIAVFGGHTRIVDGLTRATTGFLGSQIFGRILSAAPDSSSIWVGWSPTQDAVRIYDAGSLAQISERTDFEPRQMLSADVDGDGRAEVLAIDGLNHTRVLAPSTLDDKWRYDLTSIGLNNVQSGNFRGVGSDELLVTAKWGIDLINGVDGRHVASSHWGGGLTGAFGIADIDVDGRPELVTSSGNGDSLTKALDLESAQIEWRHPSASSNPLNTFHAGGMQFAQMDDDPALEIVLTGMGTDGLRMLDGESGNTELEVRGSDSGSTLFGLGLSHPKLIDLVGDAKNEIVFCTSNNLLINEQVRVIALSANDGAEVWRSRGLGGLFASCSGLEYYPATPTHNALFVLLSGGSLYGIDASSGEILWTKALRAMSAITLEQDRRNPTLVIQTNWSEVVHLDPYTQQELLRYPAYTEAMAAVPNRDQYWLLNDNQLSLRNRDGALLETIPIRQRVQDPQWFASSSSPILAASAVNGKTYLSISLRGVVLTYDFDTDRILHHGFE